jgi:hypothetical protein
MDPFFVVLQYDTQKLVFNDNGAGQVISWNQGDTFPIEYYDTLELAKQGAVAIVKRYPTVRVLVLRTAFCLEYPTLPMPVTKEFTSDGEILPTDPDNA